MSGVDAVLIGDSEDEVVADSSSSNTINTINGVCITNEHLETASEGWLTDEVITAFSYCLLQDVADVHCCSTFFYSSLESGRNVDWLNRWRRSSQFDRRRLVFVPLNWSNSHWALIVVHVQDRLVEYYDSMMASGVDRGQRALDLIAKTFSSMGSLESGEFADLIDAIQSLKIEKDALAYRTSIPIDQQQQMDGSSCGVFVCWHMARLAGLDCVCQYSVLEMRQFIRNTLETGKILPLPSRANDSKECSKSNMSETGNIALYEREIPIRIDQSDATNETSQSDATKATDQSRDAKHGTRFQRCLVQ